MTPEEDFDAIVARLMSKTPVTFDWSGYCEPTPILDRINDILNDDQKTHIQCLFSGVYTSPFDQFEEIIVSAAMMSEDQFVTLALMMPDLMNQPWFKRLADR